MNYPKVELHCHMDGAIPARLFAKYCREDGLIPEGISDEQWVKNHVMSDTMTLGECMGLFGILTGILNTKERLEETAFELLKDMYESGIKLVELRFSPQSHLSDTLSMEDSIEAVLRGRQKVLKLYPDMVCGFLICMMNLSLNLGTVKNNFRTVELAAKYKGQGVVGIDLAGNETGTPIENYEPQFELARKLGVKYTIHAGESGPASNVKFAIDQQAPRIGHGIHSIYDDKVVDELVDKGVLLEISVTSNYYARCVDSIAEHPIRKLWDRGVMVSINTDDPFLMDISLDSEYEVIKKNFGFTDRELILSNLYAARASFCEGKEKIIQELVTALKQCD